MQFSRLGKMWSRGGGGSVVTPEQELIWHGVYLAWYDIYLTWY